MPTSEPVKLGIPNDVRKRHSPEGGKTYFTGSEDDLKVLIESKWSYRKPGVARNDLTEVVVVPMDPAYFVGHTIKVTDKLATLTASFTRRYEGEDGYIGVQAYGMTPDPVTHAWVVLYHRSLLKPNELVGVSDDAEWVLVAMGASDIEDEPMPPLSMARNYLELKGGTKTVYTAQQFAEAIVYHSTRCGVRSDKNLAEYPADVLNSCWRQMTALYRAMTKRYDNNMWIADAVDKLDKLRKLYEREK